MYNFDEKQQKLFLTFSISSGLFLFSLFLFFIVGLFSPGVTTTDNENSDTQTYKQPPVSKTEYQPPPKKKRNYTATIISDHGSINLRSSPKIIDNVITRVDPNTTVEVIDKQSGWYKIKTNGYQQGFVYGSLLENNTYPNKYPVITINKNNIKLLDNENNSVRKLNKGEKFVILSKDSKNYYFISERGNPTKIPQDYVSVDTNLSTIKDKTYPTKFKSILTNDSSYVLNDSNSKLISTNILKDLDSYTLKLARNEIYARHGIKFSHDDLRCYFNKKSWYLIDNDFSHSNLNKYEKKNAQTILNYEKSINSPYTYKDMGCDYENQSNQKRTVYTSPKKQKTKRQQTSSTSYRSGNYLKPYYPLCSSKEYLDQYSSCMLTPNPKRCVSSMIVRGKCTISDSGMSFMLLDSGWTIVKVRVFTGDDMVDAWTVREAI